MNPELILEAARNLRRTGGVVSVEEVANTLEAIAGSALRSAIDWRKGSISLEIFGGIAKVFIHRGRKSYPVIVTKHADENITSHCVHPSGINQVISACEAEDASRAFK